jgi:hypothetical protein
VDDIIGWGNAFEELLENAKTLIKVLATNNFIVNREKCRFFTQALSCWGSLSVKMGVG